MTMSAQPIPTDAAEREDSLPPGWTRVEFQELATVAGGITKGQKRRGTESLRRVPYLRVANVQRGFLDLSEIKEIEATEAEINELRLVLGDILLIEGGNREHLGRGWIWSSEIPEYIHQNHVFRARLHSSELQPKFFSWYANEVGQSYFNAEASQTVNLASINLSKLKKLTVAVPPAAEQARIVAKVEALLARVNAARQRLAKVPAILKRFRQSVLATACTGRLTTDWREGQSDSETDDGELPDSWKQRTLSKLCAAFEYGSSRKSEKEGKTPVLRMGNIQDGKIDWSDLVYSNDQDEIEKYSLAPNTVLFNRTNSPELVGKTGIYRGERPAIFAGYLIRIVTGPELDPVFLNLSLNTPAFREYCQEVKTDGVSQSNINAKKLAGYSTNWCPLPEQHEIVRRVEALFRLADAIEKRVTAATARAEKLTQEVLAKAFRGELVPTEAELARREGRDYEPASVLLERIRAERERQGTDQPKRKRRGQ
jgi:type I restriction enzyme S subunit